jgi:ribonuclease G
VRQLRLRDIGGIIVIDFIDMANPKNRAAVESALRTELERDRTKTYVVEISPLGLVEMTRQNVTDGPREIMTKKCPTCGGDGIVLSETSAAVEIERRLRALAASSRSQAYRVEVAAKIASILTGPGADRLIELEKQTRRRFYLQGKNGDTHLDHFIVVAEGKREELAPQAPVEEGAKLELKLVEVGLHDSSAGVGKVDGLDICVADAAKLVGKKVEVQVERVLDDSAYATLVGRPAEGDGPITAESEAEKPTRRAGGSATAKAAEAEAGAADVDVDEDAPDVDAEPEEETQAVAEASDADGAPATAIPKKKTRRGSRGGRGRKKKTAAAPAGADNGTGEPEDIELPVPAEASAEAPAPKIHIPAPDLGEAEEDTPAEPAEDSAEPVSPPKKKTRRGSRGGRGRKKKTAAAATATVSAGEGSTQQANAQEDEKTSDWEYVPMSQWDDVEP